MTRPRGIYGPVRRALRSAAEVNADRGFTWRSLAADARVGWGAAEQTFKNMVRSGELVRIGSVQVPSSRRPMALYAPGWTAGAAAVTDDGAAD